MAMVYYKFKSAKDFDSLPIDGACISVAELRAAIFHSKKYGRGRDFHLVLSNAETQKEYTDDEQLLPKNTSVLVGRIPSMASAPIFISETQKPLSMKRKREDDVDVMLPLGNQTSSPTLESSQTTIVLETASLPKLPEKIEQHDDDLLDVLKSMESSDPTCLTRKQEDERIRALVDTPALDWTGIKAPRPLNSSWVWRRDMPSQTMAYQGNCYTSNAPVQSACRVWKTNSTRASLVLANKKPPANYICFRCAVPGHFIQHCPTNGDPSYDFKRLKRPRGVPLSMLVQDQCGSYASDSGEAAVMRPDEAAFEKEMGGVHSTRPSIDIPPELQCSLCHEVIKNAAMTSRCCFTSFCDGCIRDYLISNHKCVCGSSDVLADHLIPNLTLRETITRLLESTASSTATPSSCLTNDHQDKSVRWSGANGGFNGHTSQMVASMSCVR